MRKKIIIAVLPLLFILPNIKAQDWGIGARVGYWKDAAFSLDVKKYNPTYSLEFIGTYYDNNNIEFTFLYQWKTRFCKHFDFYYGYGASVGDWDNDLGLGFDGVLGVEYFIPLTKFSIAVDWMPQFRLIPERDFVGNFSFILKYTF